MAPDPLVIAELRNLFKAGATPSLLMRQIITHHEPLPLTEMDRLIRAYFREAICVPMFRASASLLATGQEGLKIAGINASVIHRMVEMRQKWASSDWLPAFDSRRCGTGESLLQILGNAGCKAIQHRRRIELGHCHREMAWMGYM